MTKIGDNAFRNCTGLLSVTFNAENCRSIGSSYFSGCTSLQDIQIGENVKVIPSYFLSGCSNITNIVIPDSVTDIGHSAFYNCTGLTNVTIGNGVTNIGNSAFSSCSSMLSIIIPDSVTDIGINAFYNCSRLAQTKLSANLQHIGENAFFGTALYTDASNWTDGVLYIDNSLITTDRILSGTYAVREGTVCMADNALNDCQYLVDLEIPASVRGIGSRPFYGCTALTTIQVDSGNTAYCVDDAGVLFDTAKTTLVCCPSKTEINHYSIPDSVICIENGAFYNCTYLASVEIPDSVTQIKPYAFYYCRSLKSINIPTSITMIPEYAFYYCGLEEIRIGDSVNTIESHAFYGCYLQNVTMGSSVKTIGSYSFDDSCIGSTSLKSVCYEGNVEQWLLINISNNPELTSAPRYYHTHDDSMPTEVRNAVDATCYYDGYSGDTVYLPCGALKEKGETIPALGHNYITTEPVPSCTRSTTKTVICSRCGQHDWSAETIIPAQGHIWANAVVTKPTCTESGYTTVTCNRCSEQEVQSWTSPLGHDWDDGEVTRESTCTENGIITYTCKRDASHTREEYTPAKGHLFGEWQQTKAPTVDNTGEAQRRCSVCGETETITLAKLPAPEKLTLNKASVTLNYKDSETLTASEAVTWSSSNEKVVKVDPATGKLTTVGKGTATITAHSVQGDKTATCEVTVKYTFIQMLIRIFLLGFIWY